MVTIVALLRVLTLGVIGVMVDTNENAIRRPGTGYEAGLSAAQGWSASERELWRFSISASRCAFMCGPRHVSLAVDKC